MKQNWKLIAGGIAALTILCNFSNICAFAEPRLQLHDLDVGQADAIFVECDGENLLIDGEMLLTVS